MTLSTRAEFLINCHKPSEPPRIIPLLLDFVGKKNKCAFSDVSRNI